jgi:predicted transcriptional regulator
MPERDEPAVRHSVEQMAMVFAEWGFPRMAARVLMTLMTADEDSLTAAELGERLGVSPAAISGAVRYLIHIGIVARVPVPGSRRERYRMPDDTWYVMGLSEKDFYGPVGKMAEDSLAALGGRDTPGGRRVGEMVDFFAFIQREMDGILARWKQERAQDSGA